jgi:hypothetical protein
VIRVSGEDEELNELLDPVVMLNWIPQVRTNDVKKPIVKFSSH